MNLKQHAKEHLLKNLNEGGVYVDFTMGNGHDTEFLCSVAKNGKVYSFDIQEQALQNTKKLLDEKGHSNYELILSGHQNVKQYVKEQIDGGMFNLGYLPGGDKTLHTMCDTTLKAVSDGIELLKGGGVLVISVYPGHDEGRREGEMLLEYLSKYDRKYYSVMNCRMINSYDSPFIIAIEKYDK